MKPMQRFTIYSADETEAWPVVELEYNRERLIRCLRAKTFDPAIVSFKVKEFLESIQAAIEEGRKP